MKLDLAAVANPLEDALLNLCKRTLKSRFFRGFYVERRYVECISGYRDLVTLHHSEKELKTVLDDIRNHLLLFFKAQNSPIWVGITTSSYIPGAPAEPCIWSELDEQAFGQYWFCIKSVKFRENEIVVKLKTVRSVESESRESSRSRKGNNTTTPMDSSSSNENTTSGEFAQTNDDSIKISDFLELILSWREGIKQTIYDFLSKDITKHNIKNALKFLFLLLISMLTGLMYATKFLGIFTIRLLAETRFFIIATTPITLKIMDVASKIVGGFFILLAMIWRDVIGGVFKRPMVESNGPQYRSIEYNKPRHRIDYNDPINHRY